MDEKILDSLIKILQKHTNAIRKMTELNIALGDLLRQSEERAGVPYEEFEERLQASLENAGVAGPPHDWYQGVAREIEETLDLMNILETQRKETPN